MKKYVAIVLCLALCLTFVGCRKTEKNNKQAKAALQKVLDEEADFTFKSLINESTTQENLTKFTFSTVYSAMERFVPTRYMYADFDGDEVEELLIAASGLQFCLMLHYEDGTVYGNILDYISHKYIGKDGSFLIESFGGDKRQLCTISFDGPNCKLETLAYISEYAKTYQVDYKDVSKSEAEAYIEKWDEETEKLTWVKIEQ